jgi:hypothetical protein
MRKKLTVLAIAILWAVAATIFAPTTPHANADVFNYPCTYPFVGSGADVNVLADVGGQYCDGPTEVNWSHYHCQTINANVNIGALGFVSAGGLNLGGFGGNGIGGKIFDCHYVCPDGFIAPFPNPPAKWIQHMVLNPKDNDCDQHMGVRGPSSTPMVNELPGNMLPGEGAPPGVPVPVEPGSLPPGMNNPPALPGPSAPETPKEPASPTPGGQVPGGENSDIQSPLTPGGPIPLP